MILTLLKFVGIIYFCVIMTTVILMYGAVALFMFWDVWKQR